MIINIDYYQENEWWQRCASSTIRYPPVLPPTQLPLERGEHNDGGDGDDGGGDDAGDDAGDGDGGYGAISPRRASKYENPTQRNRRQPWPQS